MKIKKDIQDHIARLLKEILVEQDKLSQTEHNKGYYKGMREGLRNIHFYINTMR